MRRPSGVRLASMVDSVLSARYCCPCLFISPSICVLYPDREAAEPKTSGARIAVHTAQ